MLVHPIGSIVATRLCHAAVRLVHALGPARPPAALRAMPEGVQTTACKGQQHSRACCQRVPHMLLHH